MKSVKLKNLDCANCALKIEKKLNELEELNNVSLNFSTATLSFEKNVKHDVLEKIAKIGLNRTTMQELDRTQKRSLTGQ